MKKEVNLFKGLLIVCFILLMSGFGFAANTVTVNIPNFKVVVDYSLIDSVYNEYPFLVYKDITYFPMTWDYCRALNLTTSWVQGKGLYVAYHPAYADMPVDDTKVAAKYYPNVDYKATIVDYPVYVNTRKIDNANQEYPLLNFNDITYFPMTWDYAHDEFDWNTSWTDLPPQFTLELGNPVGYSFSLANSKDEYAKIYKDISVELGPNEDGDMVYTNENEMYKLDYKNDSLSKIDKNDYEYYDGESIENVEINNGKIMYNKVALCEIDGIVEEKYKAEDCRAYGRKYVVTDEVSYYCFTVYTDNITPAPYTPHEYYNFVYMNNEFIQIAPNSYIFKACMTKDGCYVNAKEYTGWKGYTYPQYILYFVSNDGKVECINDRYPDYNRMKLIGNAQNDLYIKATWCPEKDMVGYGDGYASVSAINDGYFILRQNGTLERISRYIYADDEFVSPNGDLYLILNRKGEILNFTKGISIS